ncbi:PepSY domain-containing protein [Hymenobacter norwichensis]|uniref:PepSY domain-containing protein n=1 Tax=Hymenobacter norwichensis TaxID=223903 RepID=UPI0003FDDA60|nr:PepSY domain-containing protein [Hymenobacter norwichensis]
MQTTSSHPPATPARRGPVRRYVQRNIYRWHRIIGLITIVPTICWTLSGLLHPLMSNWLRPTIARESLPPVPAAQPVVPLTQVLARHALDSLRNVRLVRWQNQPAYQVLLGSATAAPRYFSAVTGAALPADADQQFAGQLARYFLQDSTARLVLAERLTGFSTDYPFVNRLLPVWKLTFERAGVTTVYVETMPARLASFNNPTRAAFLRFFSWLHSWSWLEQLSGSNTVRVVVVLVVLSVILASTLSGLAIYGLLWGRFRKPRNSQDQVGWLRKYHRAVGLAVAFVTLTFAGSGAFHISRKLHPDERLRFQHAPLLATTVLTTDLTQLPLDWLRVQNVGLVDLNGQAYYQVMALPAPKPTVGSAPGASTGQPVEAVRVPEATYYSTATGQVLPGGTMQYARFLANTFLAQADGQPAPPIKQTELIDHFEGEYGFVNKRLPVVKVAYTTPAKTTLYVEPATGRLAARVENADRYEGLSFAFLHKYHAVGSLGKNVRDAITMLAAAGVLAVSLLGLWLFVKVK